jgi:hypothetical protein
MCVDISRIKWRKVDTVQRKSLKIPHEYSYTDRRQKVFPVEAVEALVDPSRLYVCLRFNKRFVADKTRDILQSCLRE